MRRKKLLIGGFLASIGIALASNYAELTGPEICQELSGSYLLSLQSGWNLVGTSVAIDNSTLYEEFSGINYIWVYNDYINATSRRYNNTNSTWLFWSSSPAINTYVNNTLHYPILDHIPAFTGVYIYR
jgi:hypothetical protein